MGAPFAIRGLKRGLSVMDIKGSHRRTPAIIRAYRRKRMRHTKILAVIAGVLTCARTAQAGDVYKYVDERGNTLYTDKPIPGAVLRQHRRPAPAGSRRTRLRRAAVRHQCTARRQQSAHRRRAGRSARRRHRRQGSRSHRAPNAARRRATIYQKTIKSLRLYRDDQDGKREYLTEAELAQQRVDARSAVETICGPQG